MVGNGTDVRSHGDSREEIRSAPLHVDALEGIGIVTNPELVEPGQDAVTCTTTAAGAGLDDQVGILGADTVTDRRESLMVADIELGLPVGRKIRTAVAADGHVGVPFDVSDAGIVGHEPVHDAEDIVLHGGIAQVKDDLAAAAPLDDVAAGGVDDPVGMLLIEL